jgi:phytanoyl-CoA hydroxylase
MSDMAITLPEKFNMAEVSARFSEDGFFIAKAVFSPDEVATLNTEFDWIVDRLTDTGESLNARWGGPEMESMDVGKSVVLHTHNVQQFSSVWAKALYQENFMNYAGAILGPDIVLHHTKLFQKPSEEGAPFPMHQDWSYFPTEKDTMIAAIIHVSEATDEMGCLRVYPGSHRFGRVSGSSGQVSSELLMNHPLSGATHLTASPGDVVFFSYFTLHGSMPNRSPKTRKTVLVQMYSGSDKVEDGNSHTDERWVLKGRNRLATRSRAGAQK